MKLSETKDIQGKAVLDLATLAADGSGNLHKEIFWPTPYKDYAYLSQTLVDKIVSGARAAVQTPELEAVVESKLYDTVTDLAVIARLALDLHNTRTLGKQVFYNRKSNPWLHFLDEGGNDASHLAGERAWYHRKTLGAIANMKRHIRRWNSDACAWLLPTTGRYDVLSRNILMTEFLECDPAHQVDISPNYRNWPAPTAIPGRSRQDRARGPPS